MSTDASVMQKPKVHIWRIRNKLKERATLGMAGNVASFDPTALDTAQEQFEQMSEEYADWVGDTFVELSGIIAELAELEMGKRLPGWERIHRIAHELKGQGGTFGYPLISIVAKSLQECTRPKTPMGDNNVKILKAHGDAMQAMIKERISGDGGNIGRDLLEGLKIAIAKHKAA